MEKISIKYRNTKCQSKKLFNSFQTSLALVFSFYFALSFLFFDTAHIPPSYSSTESIDQAIIISTSSTKKALEPSYSSTESIDEAINTPSTKKALECLRHTKPELPDISYPQDAFQHFLSIHYRLSRWAQHVDHKPHHAAGYSGPWIENRWISYFQHQLDFNNYSLPQTFGPYVPLLIPWSDIWVKNKFKYPKELVLAMQNLLREDVLYITVSQNADGFVGRCEEFQYLQDKFHITVLSAGGYGHVPIPLLKQQEIRRPKIPLNEREHLISYVGSAKNAPNHMRETIVDMQNIYYYYGDNWRDVMRQSKFSLCPRGYGRTSYHVMEVLQMGLIPIQVYLGEDRPWLPYGNLMKNISYAVAIEKLPNLIDELSNLNNSEITSMEFNIGKLRKEYFSFEGVIKQIAKFMLNPTTSDLMCQALAPDSGSAKPKLSKIT